MSNKRIILEGCISTFKKQNEISQFKVELFSGSSDNIYHKHKHEQEPLFVPSKDLTFIHGMPNTTDIEISRYLPGKWKNGEKMDILSV